jgi:hypothetical protein
MIVEFHHGALSDTYEEQANKQGLTFGDYAKFVQDVGFGLVAAHIHGVITDSEFDKILQRFQKKILLKHLKKLDLPDTDVVEDGEEEEA